MAWKGRNVARLVRRPTLTAPARVDVSEARVGTKKRASRSNKETDEEKRGCAALPKLLDKKGPIQGVIFRRDRDKYHGVAFYNASPELIDFVRSHPITPGRHTITARVALDRRTVHVADLQADPEYKYALRDVEAIRTELGVPIFRGDDILGVFILYSAGQDP